MFLLCWCQEISCTGIALDLSLLPSPTSIPRIAGSGEERESKGEGEKVRPGALQAAKAAAH